MPLVRPARFALVSFVALATGACSDAATTGPAPLNSEPLTPAYGLMSAGTVASPNAGTGIARAVSRTAPVLRRTSPIASNIVVYGLISPAPKKSADQIIRIPEAGLTLSFPYNAVRTPTRIKVTAYAGSLVSYSFEPHGTQFDTTVRVQQDIRMTTASKGGALLPSLTGAYLANDRADIDQNGVATVAELFSVYYNESDAPGQTKLNPNFAKFNIRHFSGYIIATGCK